MSASSSVARGFFVGSAGALVGLWCGFWIGACTMRPSVDVDRVRALESKVWDQQMQIAKLEGRTDFAVDKSHELYAKDLELAMAQRRAERTQGALNDLLIARLAKMDAWTGRDVLKANQKTPGPGQRMPGH
jgi:hypothetical protein